MNRQEKIDACITMIKERQYISALQESHIRLVLNCADDGNNGSLRIIFPRNMNHGMLICRQTGYTPQHTLVDER